jgi:Na+/phosphate symporter
MGKEAPVFDALRASVNLVVASILIALATSLKLPLSTTYVTFMVAMGTSLADQAWGRESAVYRITGVLSVIGGWFFTAFSAFTVAFVMANIMMFGGNWSILVLVIIVGLLLFRSNRVSKKRKLEQTRFGEYEIEEINGQILSERVLEKCKISVAGILKEISKLYSGSIKYLQAEDRKKLKEVVSEVNRLNKETKKLKSNIYNTVRKLQEESIDSGLYYVQVLDYLRETAHCLTYISEPFFEHLDNNHKPLSPDQFEDLKHLNKEVQKLITDSVEMIQKSEFSKIQALIEQQTTILDHLRMLRKNQLKRIKKEKQGTKVSMLYLSMLHETQNMLLHLINLLKAQRDFETNGK